MLARWRLMTELNFLNIKKKLCKNISVRKQHNFKLHIFVKEKSRILETINLWSNADSSTITIQILFLFFGGSQTIFLWLGQNKQKIV